MLLIDILYIPFRWVSRQAAKATSVEMNTIVSQIRIFKWKWKINGNKGSLISPVFLPKTLTAWGLNPGRPGANLTRYLETLPDYKPMVNIQLIYVTRNTTYAFNRSASLFLLMVTVFPFWVIICLYSYRPPQAASVCRWKRSRLVLIRHLIHDSTFTVLGWLHISWARVIHDNVSLVWTNLSKARLNCIDGMALASSGSWH